MRFEQLERILQNCWSYLIPYKPRLCIRVVGFDRQPLWSGDTFYWNFIKLCLRNSEEAESWSFVAYTKRFQRSYSNHKSSHFTREEVTAYSVWSRRPGSRPLQLICIFMDTKLFLKLLFTRLISQGKATELRLHNFAIQCRKCLS